MGGRFGVRNAYQNTGSPYAMQHPLALHVLWAGAFVLGGTLLQKQPSSGAALLVHSWGFFRWHL